MRYTPVELRHVRLDRALFGGYKRGETDALLSDVADSFEDVGASAASWPTGSKTWRSISTRSSSARRCSRRR